MLAFKASDLSRDSARDIVLDPLNDSNVTGDSPPYGIWTDGTTMFVTGDNASSTGDHRVFTYRYRDNAVVTVSGEPSVGETLTASALMVSPISGSASMSPAASGPTSPARPTALMCCQQMMWVGRFG